ncbi:BamA/TamA family outer membrane protein [Pontibacter indicus]|uniref:BamA/TamA family outer membrane protein n=1 Tax=Pontibacter indicus TaxID=1317125 RepID=UPI001BAFC662|nr:BamA/TamA family outer membrane protein [Pontibacter indicus]
MTVAIAPEYNQVSKSHTFWLGNNYRNLWATPVKLRVFHLDQEKGGMKILKKGGGMQTKSLRLEDSTGQQWVLRTVQKDPGLALPENLRETVARAIVQDQISASHPFGALVVPPLAEALGIPHAKPEIVYMPDSPELGEYRNDFANQVYLFEEREPIEAEDTDNTEKVLEKLKEDHDDRVDQQLLLRARLLDIVIGDWDRHEDQWRWVELEDSIGDYYLPFPRDRDQVFFTNEGVIPKIGSRKWIMPKFQGFDEKIRDINGFNFNARYFDRMFLAGLSEGDWRAEIANVQQTLTDELIREAVRRMPANIQSLSGEELARKMIARRNKLQEESLHYYRFLSKEVDVPGSDKRELFEVSYQENGSITVTVFKMKKDDSRGRQLYERTFDPGITNEVRLYGRGGEDVFSVSGAVKSPIKVRMIGGNEADRFVVADGFQNRSRLHIYDRSDKDNQFPKASTAKFHLAEDTTINAYDPKAFEYNVIRPLLSVGYNLDDGVLLGAGFQYTKHGFRKKPFAATHKFMLGHALTTNATFFTYSGYFTEALGKNDLSVEVDGRAPNNTSNFFGIGNETEFIEMGDKPIRFYRSRYDFITSQVRLHRNLSKQLKGSIGLMAQYYNSSARDNAGRFLIAYEEQSLQEDVFTRRMSAGLVAGLELDTRNDAFMPTKGVYWHTSLLGVEQLDKGNRFGQLRSEFSFYLNPKGNSNVALANRIGGGVTVGDPYFYQLLYLGGHHNLRGFRNFRFAGEHLLYNNLELRLKLFDFTSYLFPGSVGVVGFNDVGRVWADNEKSNTWHTGYGGGLYLIPAKLVLLQAVVGFSEEDVLPYVSLGFRF